MKHVQMMCARFNVKFSSTELEQNVKKGREAADHEQKQIQRFS